jgi:D-3-phosphoglycerate dehydrogenase
MNISILEPIGISLEECGKELPGHHVTEVDSRGWPDDQLIAAARDAEVVAISNRPLSAKVIDSLPKLKLVAVAFAGIDHVDAASTRAKKIAVKNSAGYANTAVTELVFGFMISLARRIVTNANTIEHGAISNTGTELKGKVIGIIGMGAIGKEVARLAAAFGMKVLAYDRKSGVSLEDIFVQSDFVTLHVPLTPETRGLVNLERLKRMKPTAFIINAARGPVIATDALRLALENGIIAGAALDVFDMEPPLPEHYALLDAPNLIATPHIGFNTQEAVAAKGRITLDNIVKFVGGTI